MNVADFVDIQKAAESLGEPEYEFVKTYVSWSSGRSRHGGKNLPPQHYHREPVSVSRDEFEANFEESRKTEWKRFTLGPRKFQESFWLYERKLKTPGWRQKLIEMLQQDEKNSIDLAVDVLKTK